jgi:hypothetical protein
MSLFGLQRGQPQTESANFASTSAVNMLTATGPGKDNGIDVTQIIVANPDASARTITISRWDGSTAWPILAAKSIPATDLYAIEVFIRLLRGESIRVTPGNAASITVHINYMQTAN